MAFCFGLLRRDVPCRILGRDIGAQLAGVVKKMHAASLEDFLTRLQNWKDREVQRCLQEDRSPERIQDQYECLRFFADYLDESSRSVPSLLAKIDLMFGEATDKDMGSRVVLSTIHKAKGLEFPTVFLLDRTLLPSRYAKQPWQQKQEKNLLYVAVTRAILHLFYISSDCWQEVE